MDGRTYLSGPNLAKPQLLAKSTLSGDAHCAEAYTKSSLSSFDYAFRLDYTAFLRGLGLPVPAKLRSKRFGVPGVSAGKFTMGLLSPRDDIQRQSMEILA